MFSQTDIDRLIDAMRANGVVSLDVRSADDRLELRLAATPAANTNAMPITPSAPKKIAAKSPCIGRFVSCGQDDGLAPVAQGADVQAGDTLGFVAQGVALAPVVAPASGRLASAPPAEGVLFGYGDSVFDLEVAP